MDTINEISVKPRQIADFRVIILNYAGRPVEITELVIETSIFENIFDSVLTGEVIVLDNSNMIASIPLLGQEMIIILWERDNKPYGKIFHISKITDVHRVNENTASIKLHIATQKEILNSTALFSKSFSGYAPEIIDRIYKEFFYDRYKINSDVNNRVLEELLLFDLGLDERGFFNPTELIFTPNPRDIVDGDTEEEIKNNIYEHNFNKCKNLEQRNKIRSRWRHKVVFPYMKPLQAIDMVMKNILAEPQEHNKEEYKYGTPYLFYETFYVRSTILTTFEKLIEQEPIKFDYKPGGDNKLRMQVIGFKQTPRNYRGDIMNYGFNYIHSVLDKINLGAYGSLSTYIDLAAHNAKLYNFNYIEDAPLLGEKETEVFSKNSITKYFRIPGIKITEDRMADYYSVTPSDKIGVLYGDQLQNLPYTRNTITIQNKYSFIDKTNIFDDAKKEEFYKVDREKCEGYEPPEDNEKQVDSITNEPIDFVSLSGYYDPQSDNGLKPIDKNVLLSYRNRFSTMNLVIYMDSSTLISAGNLIEVEFNAFMPKYDTGTSYIEPMLSGNYIIMACRHYIKNVEGTMEYTVSLECTREGVGHDTQAFDNSLEWDDPIVLKEDDSVYQVD